MEVHGALFSEYQWTHRSRLYHSEAASENGSTLFVWNQSDPIRSLSDHSPLLNQIGDTSDSIQISYMKFWLHEAFTMTGKSEIPVQAGKTLLAVKCVELPACLDIARCLTDRNEGTGDSKLSLVLLFILRTLQSNCTNSHHRTPQVQMDRSLICLEDPSLLIIRALFTRGLLFLAPKIQRGT